jgi:tetratricopeptide (TPR) repeat protein
MAGVSKDGTMKRRLWLTATGIVVVAAGFTLIALPRGPEWTTTSPQALAEFEAAMAARNKLYEADAIAHLERALELDPGFVMAKIELCTISPRESRERCDRLMEEALSSDPANLTPRERFMVERVRLIRAKRIEEARQLLDAYLSERPDDPLILEMKAAEVWHDGDNETAERLYRRLLEISPNWVLAYNQLGYITMLQGRFVEAEEYLTSYRFIAPDQANPHDSLGELFIILGRYEEAEQSLQRAIAIKRDFWASYDRLMLVRSLRGDFAGMRQVVEDARAAGDCPQTSIDGFDCFARLAELEQRKSWDELAAEPVSRCQAVYSDVSHSITLLRHRAACVLGLWDLARDIEDSIKTEPEKGSQSMKSDLSQAMWLHMSAARLALQGEIEQAVEHSRKADEMLGYYNAQVGLFKLNNRLLTVEALRSLGREAEAHKLLDQVRMVNPPLAREFEQNGLRILGIPRHSR